MANERLTLSAEERAALERRLEEGRRRMAEDRGRLAADRGEPFESLVVENVAARAALAVEPEPPAQVMPPLVHEGAVPPARIEEPDEAPPADEQDEAPDESDDFERFLAAQDTETREVLSDVELRVIFETETKRAHDERKAAVRKAAAARAQRHAKATAGLLPADAIAAAELRDRLSQKVRWTVNMPEAGNSGMLIDEGIRINGRLLYHGEEVTGTLAEYESYRAIEWNAHQNELDFQGRGKMSKLRQTATGFLNMKGVTL